MTALVTPVVLERAALASSRSGATRMSVTAAAANSEDTGVVTPVTNTAGNPFRRAPDTTRPWFSSAMVTERRAEDTLWRVPPSCQS